MSANPRRKLPYRRGIIVTISIVAIVFSFILIFYLLPGRLYNGPPTEQIRLDARRLSNVVWIVKIIHTDTEIISSEVKAGLQDNQNPGLYAIWDKPIKIVNGTAKPSVITPQLIAWLIDNGDGKVSENDLFMFEVKNTLYSLTSTRFFISSTYMMGSVDMP